VADEEFAEMAERVRLTYGNMARFFILTAHSIIEGARPVGTQSLLSPPTPGRPSDAATIETPSTRP